MGSLVLRDLLVSIDGFDLDDSLYVDKGVPIHIDSPITITKFDPDNLDDTPPSKHYILGIEQLRNAISAAEMALGRPASVPERFRAVVHFIDHDAFADVDILLGTDRPTN